MGINKLILFVLVGIMLNGMVSAIEFTLAPVDVDPFGVYQGDSPELTAKVIASSNNICDMKCTWTINVGPDFNGYVSGDSNPPSTIILKGEDEIFPFKVNTEGQGNTNYILTVSCVREPDYEDCWLTGGEKIETYEGTLVFLHSNDGICTTEREKCEDYLDYTKDLACVELCSDIEECRPDSSRGADEYGCATYCGNEVPEKEFGETCSSCPGDVGKCNLISCIVGSECEGGYCIHGKCWDNLWRDGDGFCDFEEEESCKNSGDCACLDNERCGNVGICETYCGNGICEANEEGICAADCKWCGDNECSGNENCRTCENDCGVCESSQLTQQISESIKGGVQESLKSVSERQKRLTLITIAIIILFIAGYLIFKLIKTKKKTIKKEKDSSEKKKFDKKAKIAELKNRIKEHKKIIKEVKKK